MGCWLPACFSGHMVCLCTLIWFSVQKLMLLAITQMLKIQEELTGGEELNQFLDHDLGHSRLWGQSFSFSCLLNSGRCGAHCYPRDLLIWSYRFQPPAFALTCLPQLQRWPLGSHYTDFNKMLNPLLNLNLNFKDETKSLFSSSLQNIRVVWAFFVLFLLS